jgi:hypothetical protein
MQLFGKLNIFSFSLLILSNFIFEFKNSARKLENIFGALKAFFFEGLLIGESLVEKLSDLIIKQRVPIFRAYF